MKKQMTWKQRLNLAVNRAARVTYQAPELEARQKLEAIRAKAAAHLANNPAPRACYLLG